MTYVKVLLLESFCPTHIGSIRQINFYNFYFWDENSIWIVCAFAGNGSNRVKICQLL